MIQIHTIEKGINTTLEKEYLSVEKAIAAAEKLKLARPNAFVYIASPNSLSGIFWSKK
jgi:hypothetical protein